MVTFVQFYHALYHFLINKSFASIVKVFSQLFSKYFTMSRRDFLRQAKNASLSFFHDLCLLILEYDRQFLLFLIIVTACFVVRFPLFQMLYVHIVMEVQGFSFYTEIYFCYVMTSYE